jgi:hypothetical protein
MTPMAIRPPSMGDRIRRVLPRAPTEKEDGCRGVRDSANQPETLVAQGSNKTAGYPLAGIPTGIGKIQQSKVIPNQDSLGKTP